MSGAVILHIFGGNKRPWWAATVSSPAPWASDNQQCRNIRTPAHSSSGAQPPCSFLSGFELDSTQADWGEQGPGPEEGTVQMVSGQQVGLWCVKGNDKWYLFYLCFQLCLKTRCRALGGCCQLMSASQGITSGPSGFVINSYIKW